MVTKIRQNGWAFIFAALLSSMLLVWGWQIFPLPGGDSIDVLPPAMEIAKGNSLVNPLSMVAGMMDSERRFLYYPPLFQLVVGHAMPSADPQWMFLIIGFINSACLFMLAYFLVRRGVPPWIAFLTLLATATTMTYHRSGRAETLACLIFMLGWAASLLRDPRYRIAAMSMCMGAMAATHVVGYILCIPLVWMVEGFYGRTRTALISTVAIGAGSSLWFFLLMAWSPLGTFETLKMIHYHATLAVFPVNPHKFHYYYLFHPQAPGFAGVLMAAAAAVAAFLHRLKHEVPSGKTVWAGFIVFMALDYYFAGRSVNRNYNLLLFSPLFFYLLAEAWSMQLGRLTGRVIIVLTLIVASSGYVRLCALYGVFLKSGVSLEQGRERMATLMKESPTAHIGITSGLWVLSEDYDRMYQWEPGVDKTYLHSENSVRLLQQNNYALAPEDPVGNNYQRTIDFFVKGAPRIYGFRLGRVIPGYAFAVYVPPEQAKQ
jgi:hypothetical protein